MISSADLANANFQFIELHRKDDVNTLALQAAKYPQVDMPFALTQIEGWQKARMKIPSFAEHEGIIYPPRRAMEQCSSEATALYKRNIVARLLSRVATKSRCTMVDLTGGFGVDCAFLSPLFDDITYIERDTQLCDIAKTNFKNLALPIHVLCGAAQELLPPMKPFVFAYLDPDRRDGRGRHFALEDCSPNVKEMNALLLDKALFTLVKLSPMLDWHAAVKELRGVREVHIVSVDNECKELLLVLSSQAFDDEGVRVYCVNNGQTLSFAMGEETLPAAIAHPLSLSTRGFLYEPNASIMKAGCFALVGKKYKMAMIEKNSHLFISPDKIVDFCGRGFNILSLTTMNKTSLKESLQGIDRANVVVRNFPLTAEALRKRLRIEDGGENFIFATTDSSHQHLLIICRRTENQRIENPRS